MSKCLIAVMFLLITNCGNSKFTSGPECSIKDNKITCNGKTIEVKDGKDGQDGRQGDKGNNGSNGDNGSNGMDGINGTSGLFVDILDPCGQETQFDEVILITRDGKFLAYFAENGAANKARLVLLDEGINYTTTDGTSCNFRIENGILLDTL